MSLRWSVSLFAMAAEAAWLAQLADKGHLSPTAGRSPTTPKKKAVKKKAVKVKAKKTKSTSSKAKSTSSRSAAAEQQEGGSDGCPGCRTLQQEKEGLRSELWYLRDQLDAARTEARSVAPLQEESTQLRAAVEALEAERDELLAGQGGGNAAELVQLREECARALSRAAAAESLVEEAGTQLAAAEASNTALSSTAEAEKVAASAAEARLATENTALTRAVEQAEKRVSEAEAGHGALRAELSALAESEAASAAALATAKAASTARITELEGRLAEAEEERNAMQAKLAEAERLAVAAQRISSQMGARLEAEGEAAEQRAKDAAELQAENQKLRRGLARVPRRCASCGLPWDVAEDGDDGGDPDTLESELALLSAASGGGSNRLHGIERAVSLLRQEHCKQIAAATAATEQARARQSEAVARCAAMEEDMRLTEQAMGERLREIEADAAARVRESEEKVVEAERRADMGLVSARLELEERLREQAAAHERQRDDEIQEAALAREEEREKESEERREAEERLESKILDAENRAQEQIQQMTETAEGQVAAAWASAEQQSTAAALSARSVLASPLPLWGSSLLSEYSPRAGRHSASPLGADRERSEREWRRERESEWKTEREHSTDPWARRNRSPSPIPRYGSCGVLRIVRQKADSVRCAQALAQGECGSCGRGGGGAEVREGEAAGGSTARSVR